MSDKRLLKYLEEYVLSSDKEGMLSKLLPDTDEYTYLKFTHELVTKGGVLEPGTQESFDRLIGKEPYDFKKGIRIRKLLYDLSKASTKEEKISLCKKINKITFKAKHTHKKPKIAEKMQTNTGEEVKKESKLVLGADAATCEISIDKTGEKQIPLNSIKSGYILDRNLDELLKTIIDKSSHQFTSFINRLPTLRTVKNLNKHLLNYMKKDSNLNESIFRKMTLKELVGLANEFKEQKKEFKELGVSFVNELFNKQFPDTPSINGVRDSKTLKQLYQFALDANISKAYPNLKRIILKQLIEASTTEEKPEKELLETFIMNPTESCSIFHAKQMQKWVADYTSFSFVHDSPTDVRKVISDHLKLLFRQGQDITRFQELLSKSFVSKLLVELQLKKGMKIERVLETLTKEELDFLNDEKSLLFSSKKKEFGPDEEVKLKLDLKNINKIEMKVFEINTKSYCCDLKKNVDDRVKLDGLMSVEEKEFKYNLPSIVCHEETFDVPVISKKKRGVFIIDFVGDGIMSRTVIRKGHLNLITKKTTVGYLCKILDEEQKECKNVDTGIYYQDTYYPASSDGSIVLPYPKSSGTQHLVLQHEGFCYYTSPSFEPESISINASWLFNEETFLPGNQCNMVLRVAPYLCGGRVSVTKITAATLDFEFTKTSNVKSSTSESISFKDGEDYVHKFYLPNNTKQISIKLTLNYLNFAGEKQTSVHQSNINLIDRQNNAGKTHVFLKKEAEGYVLYHLGKNGEPIENTDFIIRLKYIWNNEQTEHKLVTDKRGAINLGNLPGVSLIGTQVDEAKEEKLNTYFNIWDQMQSEGETEVVILENKTVSLPVLRQFEEKGIEFVLQKLNRKTRSVIEECSQLVVKQNGQFKIDGLKAGFYLFRYTKGNVLVQITVLPGKELNQEFIQFNDLIYRLPDKSIRASNIVSESITDKEVELSLDYSGPHTRVHVFSETFFEEGSNSLCQIRKVQSLNHVFDRISKIRLNQPKTSYMEERQLPGEMIYAMNRKNNEAAIGTTLEKPGLFIKKQEIKQTSYAGETVTQGNDYEYEEEATPVEIENDYDDDDFYESKRPRKVERKKKPSKRAYGGEDDYGNAGFNVEDDYSNSNPFSVTSQSTYDDSFEKSRAFLNNASKCVANLKPDDKGKVRFQLKDFPTRTFKVFVVNDEYCTSKTVCLGETSEFGRTDLTLKTPSDTKQMFAYDREVYKIKAGERKLLPGFATSEYELIDSVAKLMSVKKDLSGDPLGDKWDFLKNWEGMKRLQRITTIDQMYSYELALFIFKKDKELFNLVLKDFIKCKINKTLLDYYLLEDNAKLESYLSVEWSSKLNSLEKVCLIDALAKTHKQKCEFLLQSLQGDDAVNTYEGSSSFKLLFDRIINSSGRKGENVKLARQNIHKNQLQYDEERDDDDDDDESAGSADMPPRHINRNRDRKEAPRRAYKESDCEEKCEEECEDDFGGGGGLFGESDEADEDSCEEEEEAPRRRAEQRARKEAEQREIKRRLDRRNRGEEKERRCEAPEEIYQEQMQCEDDAMPMPISPRGGESEDSHDGMNTYNLLDLKKRRQEPTVSRLQQNSSKPTMEYREMGYYFQPKNSESLTIFSNLFWIDLAKYLLTDRSQAFLSENFVYVNGTDLPFVVAFMNLSQIAPTAAYIKEKEETYLELTGGNALLFLKHLNSKPQVADASNAVLAAQKWFQKDKRQEFNIQTGANEERIVKEFVKGTTYGSQVVVTNVSSVEQKIQVITEIPQGSIPVILNDTHQSLDLKLNPFSTHTLEFYFYFPTSGTFQFCPACVTRDGLKVQIQMNTDPLVVLDAPAKKTELKNIEDILAQGSKDDILNFMRQHNITNPKIFPFDNIYWLLRDADFYKQCLAILKERLLFEPIVWGYSALHGDVETFFELIRNCPKEELKAWNMMYFVNAQDSANKLEFQVFSFKEYHPIVNARFHQLSKEKSSILNIDLEATYLNFLKYFFERGSKVTVEDNMMLTYYLLLQDRIDEAFGVYSLIDAEAPQNLGLGLQYDYMGAYFDLYKGMPHFTKAKTLCDKHLGDPIASWRLLFVEIANQLAEIEGETQESKDAKQENAAKGDQEILKSKIVDNGIEVEYANLESINLEFFEVNLEVLFSLYPFMTTEFDELVFSKSIESHDVKLTKSTNIQRHLFQLPKTLEGRNLIAKVSFK